jgi:transcriptional regulator with XRE-family HTH domain
MSPAEAARTLDAAKTLGSGRAHLRLVGSVDNPDADGPGARLQSARQSQELSIHQIASALKLKPEQVAAIEAMQFNRLPGLGYALGYVRAYGELLGLVDCDGLVNEFRDTWEPVQRRREAEKSAAGSRFAVPVGIIAALGLLAWLLIWAVVHGIQPRTSDAIAPPDARIKAWADAPPVGTARATADVRALSSLKALQDVRITLRGEDGALVTDRILRKGEEISTDGLGRWFVSAPYGAALEATGYGQTAIVGEAGLKVDNWRVPNFAQIAADKAKADAIGAAEAKAAADAKLAKAKS